MSFDKAWTILLLVAAASGVTVGYTRFGGPLWLAFLVLGILGAVIMLARRMS